MSQQTNVNHSGNSEFQGLGGGRDGISAPNAQCTTTEAKTKPVVLQAGKHATVGMEVKDIAGGEEKNLGEKDAVAGKVSTEVKKAKEDDRKEKERMEKERMEKESKEEEKKEEERKEKERKEKERKEKERTEKERNDKERRDAKEKGEKIKDQEVKDKIEPEDEERSRKGKEEGKKTKEGGNKERKEGTKEEKKRINKARLSRSLISARGSARIPLGNIKPLSPSMAVRRNNLLGHFVAGLQGKEIRQGRDGIPSRIGLPLLESHQSGSSAAGTSDMVDPNKGEKQKPESASNQSGSCLAGATDMIGAAHDRIALNT